MAPDVLVAVQEQTDVAAARRAALQVAQDAGISKNDAGVLGIVVTEAATNILKHGGGGEIVLRDCSRGLPPASYDVPEPGAVEMIAIDKGKGISDLPKCFEDGYSTAGSPGTGLGAIARLSSFHQVYSLPDRGTALVARIGAAGLVRPPFAIGGISVPYPGEIVCGDGWAFRTSSGKGRLLVVDGLGHGVHASEASRRAIESITVNANGDLPGEPVDVIERANGMLRATRGAALAVLDIDYSRRVVDFTGVGNIAGAILSHSETRRQMVSGNGIAGHDLSKPKQYRYPLEPESVVVVHSDGLSANWSLAKYPGLITRDPSVIAAILFRDFRRTRDDATVVVLKQAERHV